MSHRIIFCFAVQLFVFQGDNPFTRSLESIESLVKQTTLPTRDFTPRSHITTSAPSSSTSSRSNHTRRLHPALPPFNQTYENIRLKRPLQGSPHKLLNDPVQRHGAQFGEICKNVRKGELFFYHSHK